MNSLQKKIFNILFLAALVGITIWAIFKDQDLGSIINTLSGIAPIFLFLGFALVMLYVTSEGLMIKYLLHAVHIHITFWDCMRYAFVGFFYSCITPSATGGQPMQIFYMNKKNIDIPSATIVLMLVTIEYKFVLVAAGLGIAILGQGWIGRYMDGEVQFFLYLGILLNVFCVFFMSFLVFLPETAKFLIMKGYAFLKRIHLMKEKNNRTERLMRSMEMYKNASVFLRANKAAITGTTLLAFAERFFLFFITYITYRSFGLHTEGAFTITLLQAVISISVDMLPLPGGMGISERLYLLIFTPIFGTATATTASLLMSRGFSYYLLVLVSGIVSFITHMTIRGTAKER